MRYSKLFAVTALATLATFGAHADEADASSAVLQFTSTRSAAEVRAEARNPIRISNGSSGVLSPSTTATDRAAVRAQAVQAVRMGQTSQGETGLM